MPSTSLARILDPIGITKASRNAGGGILSAWDPLGVAMKKPKSADAGADAVKPAVAAPSQPVTPASQLVLTTEQDMRRSALKKKGFAATMLAGDNGGWHSSRNQTPAPSTGPNLPGNKTLGGS